MRAAIATQHCWRGVLRELGLLPTSAGAMRTARRHADRLGIDYSHFRGKRQWSDADLAKAIESNTTWTGVAKSIGLVGDSGVAEFKGHALRLGLDYSHINAVPKPEGDEVLTPDKSRLSRIGTMLAAAWFEAAGASVAWPLEPARYDFLACTPRGLSRVQVKTTQTRSGGSYAVWLSTSTHRGGRRRVYDPDDVDEFFIVDGDLNLYRIPIQAVGGLTTLHLATYEAFRVPGLCSLAGNADSRVASAS